jgi:hypothetical protein
MVLYLREIHYRSWKTVRIYNLSQYNFTCSSHLHKFIQNDKKHFMDRRTLWELINAVTR